MSNPAHGRAIPVRPSPSPSLSPNLVATITTTTATTTTDTNTNDTTPKPAPAPRPPPHDDLERHKGIIKKLYLDDGITLREVMAVMEKQYGVKATSKVYKSRFRSWGWRKNLRIEDEVLPNVLQGRRREPTREFQLVNGQVVHSERLDRYLRRQKSRLLAVRRQLDHQQRLVQEQAQHQHQHQHHNLLCPRPRALAPPRRFHVVEELFYQILFQVPSYVRHRWGDALLQADVRGALALTQPTPATDRWALFVWALKCAMEAGKHEEAMVLMRHAPGELDVFLRSQPTEILSCGFMTLAQGTRFCHPDASPQARQFLRVIRSLTKYAASILFECAETSRSTWLHLVAVLIEVFSRIEDRDLTETVYRAWKIHSQTWDSIMSPRVSSHLSMAAGDALSHAKYRVLPTLQPAVHDALQQVVDQSDAQHGPRHEASVRALWALAQWMETEDDARRGQGSAGASPAPSAAAAVSPGVAVATAVIPSSPGAGGGGGGCHYSPHSHSHSHYSARTRALFEELRRRSPPAGSPMRVAMWRFFAEDHRARGERAEAERSLRRAVDAARELRMPGDPLVLGYVSILRDWLAEWYGADSARAQEAARWCDALRHAHDDLAGWRTLSAASASASASSSTSLASSTTGGLIVGGGCEGQGQCVAVIEE